MLKCFSSWQYIGCLTAFTWTTLERARLKTTSIITKPWWVSQRRTAALTLKTLTVRALCACPSPFLYPFLYKNIPSHYTVHTAIMLPHARGPYRLVYCACHSAVIWSGVVKSCTCSGATRFSVTVLKLSSRCWFFSFNTNFYSTTLSDLLHIEPMLTGTLLSCLIYNSLNAY